MSDKPAEPGAARGAAMWVGGVAAGAVLSLIVWYFAVPGASDHGSPATGENGSVTQDADAGQNVAETAQATGTSDANTGDSSAPAAEAATPAPIESQAVEAEPVPKEQQTAQSEPMTEADEATREDPQSTEAAAVETAPPEAATEGTAAMPMPVEPTFDTVRAEADGSVLVAGRAEAGAAISVLVDGVEAAKARGDSAGAFAAFLTLAPSEAPRVLTLMMRTADGVDISSAETVIIAPITSPEAVAEAKAAPTAPESGAVATAPEEEPDGSSVSVDAAPEVTDMTEGAVASAEPTSAPEVLIVGDDGVRRQAAGAPVAGIVIDTIGYSAKGEVEIAGRGTPGHFARLYLDNTELAVVDVDDAGAWSVRLPGIAPGVYTLRVDQVDDAGKVSARFETPFQREAPETVAAALAPEAPAVADPEGVQPGAIDAADVTASTGMAPAPTTDPAAPDVQVQSDDAPSEPAPALAAASAVTETPPVRAAVVTVQPGFTLWRIARENYGDGIQYVKVYEANKDQIRDPDLIYPGQIFNVPAQ